MTTQVKDGQFQDGNGKVYRLRISSKTAEDLKAIGLDAGLLVTDRAGELVQALSGDLSKVVEAVVIVLEAEATIRLDPESFARAMYGPQIAAAAKALLEAMADFYGPGKAPAIKAMVTKAWEAEEDAGKKLVQKVEAVDVGPQVDKYLEEAFSGIPKNFG